MLKSKRWPWLSFGWEVAEEVDREEWVKAMMIHPTPQYFDTGNFYRPYIPIYHGTKIHAEEHGQQGDDRR